MEYTGNRDTVESIDFRINQRNIRYFYEAMQNFENSLVNEALEKIAGYDYDCFLLDIMLPGKEA